MGENYPGWRREFLHHKINRFLIKRIALRQKHHHIGLPENIGIYIGRNINALSPRSFQYLKDIRRGSPQPFHCELNMGNFNGHPRHAPDLDNLLNTLLQPTILTPKMTHVASTLPCRLFCQR